MQAEKIINLNQPKIDILPIEPKDIDKYWPLAEFMVREAIRFSGNFSTAEDIKDAFHHVQMQGIAASQHDAKHL